MNSLSLALHLLNFDAKFRMFFTSHVVSLVFPDPDSRIYPILKILWCGSGVEKLGSGVRDGKKSDPWSRINIPYPQHCLVSTFVAKISSFFRTFILSGFPLRGFHSLSETGSSISLYVDPDRIQEHTKRWIFSFLLSFSFSNLCSSCHKKRTKVNSKKLLVGLYKYLWKLGIRIRRRNFFSHIHCCWIWARIRNTESSGQRFLHFFDKKVPSIRVTSSDVINFVKAKRTVWGLFVEIQISEENMLEWL